MPETLPGIKYETVNYFLSQIIKLLSKQHIRSAYAAVTNSIIKEHNQKNGRNMTKFMNKNMENRDQGELQFAKC